MTHQPKVIVGLSGGVDSSLTAWILKQRGYVVEGFFMKNWEDSSADCPATQDLIDTMKVCDKLNIHLHAENFSEDYVERVFKNFVSEYQCGRTPNPDILCNREIKFDVLLGKTKELGADFLATGHYARLVRTPDEKNQPIVNLYRAEDESKDQTYFLYALTQQQLQSSLFPLADWQKNDVRQKAKQLDLITHNKKDSTGICFIGKKPFQKFLNQYIPTKPGDIIDQHGTVLGTHMGIAFYTIGQRKGLQIGGQKNHPQQPWYVCDRLVETNQLLVVQGDQHELINHSYLSAKNLNWIAEVPDPACQKLTARIRHRQLLQNIRILSLDCANDRLQISFDKPQFAIAPGQAVVIYEGKKCLGGGVIEKRW